MAALAIGDRWPRCVVRDRDQLPRLARSTEEAIAVPPVVLGNHDPRIDDFVGGHRSRKHAVRGALDDSALEASLGGYVVAIASTRQRRGGDPCLVGTGEPRGIRCLGEELAADGRPIRALKGVWKPRVAARTRIRDRSCVSEPRCDLDTCQRPRRAGVRGVTLRAAHRGYQVRRVRAVAAIDQGRSQMASDALGAVQFLDREEGPGNAGK